MPGFGALPDVESIRIYEYGRLPKRTLKAGAAAATEFALPAERMPRLLDQGEIGACVAFAMVEVLEVLHYIETGQRVALSPGFLYGHHRDEKDDGWGMVASDAIDRLRQLGSVPETIFREYAEMPEMQRLVRERPDLPEFALPYRIRSYVSFQVKDKEQLWAEAKEALLSYELPLIAISHHYFGESHAICVYGFEEDRQGRRLKFQNSWGTSYGDAGKGTIPITEIDGLYLLLDEVVSLPFADVPEAAWYYKAILHLYAAGLVNGRSENCFAPAETMTRAEVCAVLDRLLAKLEKKDKAMMASIYDYVDRRVQ